MKYYNKGGIYYEKEQILHNNIEDNIIQDFLTDYNNVYKDVEYLIGFANKETIEPEEKFDKLIYNINKILSTPYDDLRLSNLIELINNYEGDKKQIPRIIFVILYDRDLMNKEKLNGESFGESLLRDLIKKNIDDKEIFICEYEYVYNIKFDDIPILEDASSGGNLYKNNRKYKKK